MIYKKQYGHPFDTESVVGTFLPAMETIPHLNSNLPHTPYVSDADNPE